MVINMTSTPSGLLTCPKKNVIVKGMSDRGVKRVDLLKMLEARMRNRLFDTNVPYDLNLIRDSFVQILQLSCDDSEYVKHLEHVYETSSLMCIYLNHMYLLRRGTKVALIQSIQELIEWIKAFNLMVQYRVTESRYLFTDSCYVYFYGEVPSMTLPYEEVMVECF